MLSIGAYTLPIQSIIDFLVLIKLIIMFEYSRIINGVTLVYSLG